MKWYGGMVYIITDQNIRGMQTDANKVCSDNIRYTYCTCTCMYMPYGHAMKNYSVNECAKSCSVRIKIQ